KGLAAGPPSKTKNEMRLHQDEQSWRLGYDDGRLGHPSAFPDGVNALSYHAGFIGGRAVRNRRLADDDLAPWWSHGLLPDGTLHDRVRRRLLAVRHQTQPRTKRRADRR